MGRAGSLEAESPDLPVRCLADGDGELSAGNTEHSSD